MPSSSKINTSITATTSRVNINTLEFLSVSEARGQLRLNWLFRKQRLTLRWYRASIKIPGTRGDFWILIIDLYVDIFKSSVVSSIDTADIQSFV
jgi:hypothetical protein